MGYIAIWSADRPFDALAQEKPALLASSTSQFQVDVSQSAPDLTATAPVEADGVVDRVRMRMQRKDGPLAPGALSHVQRLPEDPRPLSFTLSVGEFGCFQSAGIIIIRERSFDSHENPTRL
ncbi:hypothetical protein EV189_2304 [Motilibacter rhizosphaerae]|uniref:Uncharacterized protein n=2 Tax=Motilibacter rhizosphaerae TaxID=598652 RepID=A0A4Q7NPD6_9ACTN|nr:hypothetical protein EV189_2304 [Motilibacter rhizosphaerae]